MNNIKIELHADDLGISDKINESIFSSIDDGLVRGVSVLIGSKGAEAGINGALKRKVRVCLHLNLTDGQCLSKNKSTNYITDNNKNFNKSFIKLLFCKYSKNFKIIREETKKEIVEQINECTK